MPNNIFLYPVACQVISLFSMGGRFPHHRPPRPWDAAATAGPLEETLDGQHISCQLHFHISKCHMDHFHEESVASFEICVFKTKLILLTPISGAVLNTFS